jgi:hypothetical protein
VRLALENRNPSAAERDQQRTIARQIQVVLRNLERLVHDSPDVAALNLVAPADLRSSSPVPPFAEPPMLRAGLQAVLIEAARNPSIIAPGSPIPQIASRIYADTPWSTWKPRLTAKQESSLDWVHVAILDFVGKLTSQSKRKSKNRTPESGSVRATCWTSPANGDSGR